VLGIFRLVRTVLADDAGATDSSARATAWAAALLYAANPNLIYMQATAMGESLYLAFFIWAVVFFAKFATDSKNSSSLMQCSLCLTAACLTRYDGWFLAALLVILAVILTFARHSIGNDSVDRRTISRMALIKFVLIASAAPLLWLAYNALVYRNPLEFANGPYSAKAIEQKTGTLNPAKGSLYAAASYFLKAAELNVGQGTWPGRLWLALAIAGTLATASMARVRIALLLWIPLPFYALSVAYGNIPIFIPTWWPFSYYNVRYGLELLPAFAVFVALAISFLLRAVAELPRWKNPSLLWQGPATFFVIIAFGAANYAAIWRDQPICYREAFIGSRGRIALENQLAQWFTSFPAGSTFLMYLGGHSGAFEEAGIPLRQVINEGNHRVWKEPYDPQGLWERALADPAAYANYVVGFEGDPVWKAAKAHRLTALVEIHTSGQPPAAIFQGEKPK
jgi:hypothetical protein